MKRKVFLMVFTLLFIKTALSQQSVFMQEKNYNEFLLQMNPREGFPHWG